MAIGTVTDISLHGYEASAHAFDASSLAVYGWMIFDTVYAGSIGAFYFGPTPTNVAISAPAIANYSCKSPIITTEQNGFNIPTIWGVYSVPPPNVITTHDILVDFVGTPRVGSSPLIVDFTATIIIAGGASGTVSVSEYHWYFDTVNYPTVYEISTGPTITHVYTGYYGQKFSVKLCVKLS